MIIWLRCIYWVHFLWCIKDVKLGSFPFPLFTFWTWIDFSTTKTYNSTIQFDTNPATRHWNYLCLDSPSKIDFSLRYTRSPYVNHRLCLRKSWQEHNYHNRFQSLKSEFYLFSYYLTCTYLANSPTLDLVILEVCWMHYSCRGHKHIGHTNHTIQLQWMKRKIGLASRYFSEHQFHRQIENYHYHLLTCLKLV